jgi:hypothetical protein
MAPFSARMLVNQDSFDKKKRTSWQAHDAKSKPENEKDLGELHVGGFVDDSFVLEE